MFFLVTRGLHLSIEFTGGTVMEVEYAQAADSARCRGAVKELAEPGEVQVQNFGTARDVLIRLPVRGGAAVRLAGQACSPRCAGRAGRCRRKQYTTPQGRAGVVAVVHPPPSAEPVQARMSSSARRWAPSWPATAPGLRWASSAS